MSNLISFDAQASIELSIHSTNLFKCKCFFRNYLLSLTNFFLIQLWREISILSLRQNNSSNHVRGLNKKADYIHLLTLTIFFLHFTVTCCEILSLVQNNSSNHVVFSCLEPYCTQSALWLGALGWRRTQALSKKIRKNLSELVEFSVLSSRFSVLFWNENF